MIYRKGHLYLHIQWYSDNYILWCMKFMMHYISWFCSTYLYHQNNCKMVLVHWKSCKAKIPVSPLIIPTLIFVVYPRIYIAILGQAPVKNQIFILYNLGKIKKKCLPTYMYPPTYPILKMRGCRGHDHMLVGFTTTYAFSAFHH